MERTQLVLAYDFICPWCWIGHRNLKAGAKIADCENRYDITFLPFELNPGMPRDGMNRRAYRTRKFGSLAHSDMLDATVTAAGVAAGVHFDFGRIERTPNTRLAHRLIHHALGAGTPEQAEHLYDAIFRGYFAQGRDIGDVDTLVDLAASQGLDAEAARAHLGSDAGDIDIEASRVKADALGIRSVPTIVVDKFIVNGAQPPVVFAKALQGRFA
ncbi:Predicted dithiol-disulfide isomerase, DsbA family [Paraburkholderia unamae]|uniref:DsbA family oxidoreductase n=1 Tax=Paraburkholderia unamae TaxID=219649 RepID=UPI001CAB5346|nr:DsbA family oxidoreductase [Paraburkholderia unamae]CAG9252895.1 Predicted dithiol-disulfide isomerase, DsbA family [Paraburkholderia unamae]